MYEEIKNKFSDLEKKLVDPELLKNSKEIIKVSQEHANLKKAIVLILELEKITKNIDKRIEMMLKTTIRAGAYAPAL
jgi:protein subunit release factor A